MEYSGYIRFVTEYETKLPFFVATVGITEYETTILRPTGIEDFQLIYSFGGKGVIEINANEYEMPEGSFIIIPPFMPHHYRSISEKWCTYWVTYNGYAAERFSDFKATIHTMTDKDKFFEIFAKLLSYRNDKEFVNESSAALYELLINLKFNINENTEIYKESAKKLNYVIKYISDNLGEQLTLDSLSSLVNMSEGHFCRTFKAYTGKRPIELINEMRINRAKTILLYNPETSTTELSKLVGFDSVSYFIKVFKAKEGITPSEIKKTLYKN